MIADKILSSQRFRRLSKEGLWIIIGQIVTIAGMLVGVRILTGLMSSRDYGELALGMTIATLVNQVILGPLSNGATRFYAPAQEAGDFGGYLKALRRMVLSATGIIVIMIMLVVVVLMFAGRTEWIGVAVAALVFAILTGYNSILNGIQNAARQRSVVALHSGMGAWFRYLVAAGLILWLGSTSTAAIMGYALATVLVLGSQFWFFRKLVPVKSSVVDKGKDWSKEIWKFSWPYAAWGIFTWAQQASDRWALEAFTITQQVGLYAVLYQLGYYPILIVNSMAAQLIAPIIFQRAGDATDSRRNANVSSLIRLLTGLALGLSIAAFLAGLLLHRQIFLIFTAEEYRSVSYLLPWILLAGGIYAAGQTIELNLASRMKNNVIIAARIMTALLGIACNIAGAYFFGIKGIVISGITFSLSYFVWMAVLSKNKERDGEK